MDKRIDNAPPIAYNYPISNAKKEMIIEGKYYELINHCCLERCTEIENQNKMLLHRMENILTGKATHENYPSAKDSKNMFNSVI